MSDTTETPSREELVELATGLAPHHGYNPTASPFVRILRSEAVLRDVPVLYKPGVVFVLQGSKRGSLDGEIFLYDEEHYLAVSVPVPFRMESDATPERPLLAVYIQFEMQMAAEIVLQIEQHTELKVQKPRGLASSKMAPDIADVLLRLLKALHDPIASAVIGAGILRELHFRLLLGPQGGTMIAALKQEGSSGKIIKSLAWMRENMGLEVSIAGLARDVGMSVPSYHVHFRDLTGTSPMQYLKAMRLHEARLLVARSDKTIAEVAVLVGYVSPAQFSRDFKRHFGRTASEESKWIRRHLGELAA
ncbi:AraC family transcriptional regulator [Rhizobium laguerreae]|uniref:AraC family transcriptional regulator n=1 Tax=Rhizobium laguerreae TaxID=1076926 RepID=A0AB35FEU4_9HYPH|nr:AraC family transcriptional regulator [Rhizobium laguerreae]MBY3064508.1 AraC family transcriptional regulator [Rhizobium laguerreae]